MNTERILQAMASNLSLLFDDTGRDHKLKLYYGDALLYNVSCDTLDDGLHELRDRIILSTNHKVDHPVQYALLKLCQLIKYGDY